jgi:PAS domain S-box-containing protein
MNLASSQPLAKPASTKARHTALKHLRRSVWIFYVAATVMLLLTVAWLTREDYRNTLAATERQALSLARSLDEHIARSFVSVDQAMQNVAEDIERAGGIERVDEHWLFERIKSKVEHTPQIRAIIAMDANGVLRAHGLEYPTRRVHLGDRAYFGYHQSNIDPRLRIGEPIISRTDYKWLLPLTRRINLSDNRFDGVLLSGVEPDYFLRFYDALQLERGTRIEVLRNDGVVLLNHPQDIHRLGSNLRDIEPDSYELLLRLRHGFIRASTPHGDVFIAQLQSSSPLPLIVRVNHDASRVLRKFHADARIRIGSAVLALTILSIMLYLLLGQIRRLEQSEARLRLTQYAVDESPDMVLWCDQTGRLHYSNTRLEETIGYLPEKLRGIVLDQLLGQQGGGWQAILQAYTEQQRIHTEGQLHCQDGREIPVDITVSRLSTDNQSLYCVILRDVSERRAAQQELRRHRDHLQDLVVEQTREIRNILDASPLAIMLSVNEQVRLVNPAFERMFGYEQAAISGLPEQLVHLSSEHYNGLRGSLNSRISMGGTFRSEVQLRRRDGSSFWATLFARALEPRELERGVVFIIEDVSAQRSAAQALRQSEQIKRSVLDTAADSFALIDAQRNFVDVNQALCRQTGIPRGMLLGQTPEAVWGEARARRIFPADEYTLKAAEEIELPVAGSSQAHAFVVKRGLIPGENGEAGYTFAFFTDIQYRKEVERSLAEARDLAEAGSMAKSRFLTNMSHELRTPMHAILSFAEIGRTSSSTSSNPDHARYFERIEHAGKRLLTLLNDLLDLSRMEADHMSYEKHRNDLGSTIQVAISELSSLINTKKIRMNTPEEGLAVVARFDKARLTQVVVNLLSNAIRFSPQGGVITITLLHRERLSDGRAAVGFSVHNQGPDIASEDLERIFESFVQGRVDGTNPGTGLGLAISRRIIQDHGGSIRAHNHAEGGAIFTVKLPAEELV